MAGAGGEDPEHNAINEDKRLAISALTASLLYGITLILTGSITMAEALLLPPVRCGINAVKTDA